MTARVLVIAWLSPIDAATTRSSSAPSEKPTRIRVANSSVEGASASGYSSVKSAPTRTTPRDAKEGGPPPAFLDLRDVSGKLEDRDLGCAGDARLLHHGGERRVAREVLGAVDRVEVVGDQDVVAVLGVAAHAGVADAVPGVQRLDLVAVVDLTPRGVVLDGVANGESCGHGFQLSGSEASLPLPEDSRGESSSDASILDR